MNFIDTMYPEKTRIPTDSGFATFYFLPGSSDRVLRLQPIPSEVAMEHIQREMEITNILTKSNISPIIHDQFITADKKQHGTVMEWYEDDLVAFMKKRPQYADWEMNVCSLVRKTARHGILLLDLKFENIVIRLVDD